MTARVFTLILLSVALSALAQLMLKAGMSQPAVQQALLGTAWPRAALMVATTPWVVGGLVAYFASAAVWLLVLAHTDVSIAYPFVGLGFVLTMLLAWLLLGESLSMTRVAGTLLVTAGVVLIARS